MSYSAASVMIQALLDKQPLRRPCCEQLLQHPFLAEAKSHAANEAEAGLSSASKAPKEAAARDAQKPRTGVCREETGAAANLAPAPSTESRSNRGQSTGQPAVAPPSAR